MVVMVEGQDVANASPWLEDVATVAGDEMDVDVRYALASRWLQAVQVN